MSLMQAMKWKNRENEKNKIEKMMGIECSELKGTFFRNKKLSTDKNEKKNFHILMTKMINLKNFQKYEHESRI